MASRAILDLVVNLKSDAAERGLGGLVGGLGKLGLAGAGVGIITDAFGKLTDFLGDASKAAQEEEASVARLNQTLSNAVPGLNANSAAVQRLIEQGQNLAFSDDNLRDSLGFLVGKTGDLTKSQDFLGLAMDLSRAKHIDLETATRAVIRADDDSIGTLQKLGIAVDKSMTAEQNLQAIRAATAGQAEAYANTQAGAADRISVAWGNAVEDVGAAVNQGLAPLLQKIADWVSSPEFQQGLTSFVEGLSNAIQVAGEIMGFILEVIGKVGEALGWLGGVFDTLTGNVNNTGMTLGTDFTNNLTTGLVDGTNSQIAPAVTQIGTVLDITSTVGATGTAMGSAYTANINNELGSGTSDKIQPAVDTIGTVLDIAGPAGVIGTSIGQSYIDKAAAGIVPAIDAGTPVISARVQHILDVLAASEAPAADSGTAVGRAYGANIEIQIGSSIPTINTLSLDATGAMDTSGYAAQVGDAVGGNYATNIIDWLSGLPGGVSGYADATVQAADASGAMGAAGNNMGVSFGNALVAKMAAAVNETARIINNMQHQMARVVGEATNAARSAGAVVAEATRFTVREIESIGTGGIGAIVGFPQKAITAAVPAIKKAGSTMGSVARGEVARASGETSAAAKAGGKATGEALGEGIKDATPAVRYSLEKISDLTPVYEAFSKLAPAALATMDELAREMVDPRRNPGAIMTNLLDLTEQANAAGWGDIAATSLYWFEQIRSGAAVDFGAMATDLQARIEEMKTSSDPRLAALATQYDATWDQMLVGQQAVTEQLLAEQKETNDKLLAEQKEADRKMWEQASDAASAILATKTKAYFDDIRAFDEASATLQKKAYDFLTDPKRFPDITPDWMNKDGTRKRTELSAGESLDFLARLADPATVMPSQERIDEFFAAQRYLLDRFAAESEDFENYASDRTAHIADNVGAIMGGINTAFAPLLQMAEIQKITPQQIEGAFANIWMSLHQLNEVMKSGELQGDWQSRAREFAGTLSTVAAAINDFFKLNFDPKNIEGLAGVWRTGFNEMFGFIVDVWIPQTKDRLTGFMAELVPMFSNAGTAMTDGMVAGLEAGQAGVIDAAVAVALAAYQAAKDALGIASPSRKFAALGMMSGAGFAQGIAASTAQVTAATAGMLAIPAARPATYQGGSVGTSSAASTGMGGVQIVQHFHGKADPEVVQRAAEQGVKSAMRKRGLAVPR